MKKHFFACFTALSIAAIAASANHTSTSLKNKLPVKTIYDTVPNRSGKDSTGKWKDKKYKHRNDSTNRMNRDSTLKQ